MGMGYVFAMWMFGYQEMYPLDKALLPENYRASKQLLRGSMGTPWFDPEQKTWYGSKQTVAGDALNAAKSYQSCGPGTTPKDKNCDNSFTCGGLNEGGESNCHNNERSHDRLGQRNRHRDSGQPTV